MLLRKNPFNKQDSSSDDEPATSQLKTISYTVSLPESGQAEKQPDTVALIPDEDGEGEPF